MPLKNQLHVDQLLSNISVKYSNSEYIADKVFPTVPVKKDSDLYRSYQRNFRIPETKRASGGVAREFDFEVSSSSYILENHALKNYVNDDQADNYDISDLRADMTEELTDAIMRMKEKKVADLFTTTSWSLNVSLAAANAFAQNTTVSNPIPIFDTACTTVISNSGYKPNFGILPRQGMIACKNHVSVLDRVKYTSAEITEKMLAALFGVEELLVPMASYDSANEGVADSIGDIYGDIAFVGWKPASAGPMKPSSGYIFEKAVPRVRRWRVEERQAEAIEVQIKFQPKVVASLTGYLIKDII
jgi:hypothetical protein